MKVEDLTGQKFEHWTVIKRVENNKHGRSMWLVECDCEDRTQKKLESVYLIKGKSKSCGCTRGKDLTGQKFERLTVLKQVEKNKYGHISWLVECDCKDKTQKICTSNDLKRGYVKSCGCLKSELTIKFNKETKKKYNTYDLSGEYGIGYTSNLNSPFYFDLEDYDKIKGYCWYLNSQKYISTTDKNENYLSLHRLIMNFPETEVIDHLDRNRSDNRKENLFPTTNRINMLNQVVRSTNTSGVTGVTWDKDKETWRSYIMYNDKLKHLGFFTNIDKAIYSRLKAEKKYGYSGANTILWEEYGIT